MIPNYKIEQGDCLELLKSQADSSVDMILTDLPYGITRNRWDSVIELDALWKQYNRIAKDKCAIVLFGQGMFTAKLMLSNEKYWRYNLVWEKTQPAGFLNAGRMPLRTHEDICVFYKQLPTYNPQKTTGHERKISTAAHKRNSKYSTNYNEHKLASYDSTERYPGSIVPFESDSIITCSKDVQKEAYHPTQKPVALLEYLILTYTNKGDTVLDSCMGVGSTGVACMNTGRNFIGMEIEEEYSKIAHERISKARDERELSLWEYANKLKCEKRGEEE